VIKSHRVPLPRSVRSPFQVFLNGVPQEPGTHYDVREGALVFRQELVQEGGPSKTGWFLGFWGVGTYKHNDEIDVRYAAEGRPKVAQNLPLGEDD
jgi:hypothetical protein